MAANASGIAQETTAPSGPADTPPAANATIVAPVALETVASAARRLGLDAAQLRKRCLRKGERVGDCVVALLDDGVVAFKFGGRWRLRFPRTAAARADGHR